MAKPQPQFDLTTFEAVKGWLALTSQETIDDSEKQVIQDCITAVSAYWLWYTGLGNEDGSIPTVSNVPTSPFVKPIAYDEFYDGNGSQRMFLKHAPIRSVQLLKVGQLVIQARSAVGQPGYVIDQSKSSIAIAAGGASSQSYTTNYFPSGCGQYFAKGIQNIEVQYTAGYQGVPYDVELAARQMVAVNYKRRQWIDQASQSLAQGAGTVTFRNWEIPPEVLSVMIAHKRIAVV